MTKGPPYGAQRHLAKIEQFDVDSEGRGRDGPWRPPKVILGRPRGRLAWAFHAGPERPIME